MKWKMAQGPEALSSTLSLTVATIFSLPPVHVKFFCCVPVRVSFPTFKATPSTVAAICRKEYSLRSDGEPPAYKDSLRAAARLKKFSNWGVMRTVPDGLAE